MDNSSYTLEDAQFLERYADQLHHQTVRLVRTIALANKDQNEGGRVQETMRDLTECLSAVQARADRPREQARYKALQRAGLAK